MTIQQEKHSAARDGEQSVAMGLANAKRLAATWDADTLLAVMRSSHPRGKYAHFIRICRDELVRRAAAGETLRFPHHWEAA